MASSITYPHPGTNSTNDGLKISDTNLGTPSSNRKKKQNGWRMHPKRGISLDQETLNRSLELDDDILIDCPTTAPDTIDSTTANVMNQLIAVTSNHQQLIDGFTAQYYHASSAISEQQQIQRHHNQQQQSSPQPPKQLQTQQSYEKFCNSGGATDNMLNNFNFNHEILNRSLFRQQESIIGSNVNNNDTIDRSTRATTPADEQIFQEPVESLQVRVGRLLSCEEMADMHFLVGSGPPNTISTSSLSPIIISPSSDPLKMPQQQSSPQSSSTSSASAFKKLRIPAHRLVMATASHIFKQILVDPVTGQLLNCDEDLEITDIEPVSFLEFLRYAYTDSAKLNKDNVVGVLVAARRYQIANLERQCIEYIHKCLSKRSCLAIWIAARVYGETDLELVARKSMQHYAESMLLSNDFLRLDQNALFDLLGDDLLRADEIVIFRALTRWAKQTCLRNGLCPNRANVRLVIGQALNLIRFPLMTEEQLQRIVAAEGILDDELLRALVHCSRNWPRASQHLTLTTSENTPLSFSNEPRAFQRLAGRLHNVYRFGSFENTLPNRYLNRSMNFLANKRIWLAGVGLYAPRKACTFYLNVTVRVRRTDHEIQTWNSPLDRIEQTILLKYDGLGHMININFDEPLQIEANVQYEVSATITPSPRSTSLVRARLHPHLYYTRPNEVNFYYGTEGQYATKVRVNNRGENIIFNFNWERDAIQEESISDTTSQQNFSSYVGTTGGNTALSEPSTPNPPPRPPPPQEYRRPTRMQRLRRALSFVDNRNEEKASFNHIKESGLLEGQIPLLMFYA